MAANYRQASNYGQARKLKEFGLKLNGQNKTIGTQTLIELLLVVRNHGFVLWHSVIFKVLCSIVLFLF